MYTVMVELGKPVRKRDGCAPSQRKLGSASKGKERQGGITIMLKRTITAAVALLATLLCVQVNAATKLGYEPQADPFEAYHAAIAQAEQENKYLLIIAGGDWCHWCHVLDRFVARDAEVDAKLHDTFVVMKVYVGFDNYNDAFFSQLPPAKGAPHFWIVSPDKEVLASQSTGGFEAGKRGYDKQAFLQFIDTWKAHAAVFAAARQDAGATTDKELRAQGIAH